MSYIDHITEFLFDEHRRISSKAAVVLFIILSIIFVDNYLGFSFHYNIDKRIEQVEKVNKILSDSLVDSTTKAFALNVRSEIMERKNAVDYLFSFFRGKSNTVIKHQANKPPDNPKNNDPIIPSIKNNFWFNISAGGLYYLLAILMLPVLIFTDKTTSLPQRVGTGLVAALLFFGLGWFFYWVCTFIPQISDTTWAWNYIVNAIIQIVLVGLLISVSQKKK